MSKRLRDFFTLLNKNCTYLVLRNWDNIFDENLYSNGHGDIDILCNSLQEFVSLTGAERIHKEKNRDNYIISIDNVKVRFDVRWVGDGYYPTEWEQRMLENRELNEQSIFVMNKEDYFYSLAYHALVQKPKLSNEYLYKLNVAFKEIEDTPSDVTERDILVILSNFLIERGFTIDTPNDPGVFINKKYARKLPRSKNLGRSINREIFLLKKRITNYCRRLFQK